MEGRRAGAIAIEHMIDAVRTGAGSVLWLEGDAGLGKSHLLAALAARAAAAGIVTRAATTYELEAAGSTSALAETLGVAGATRGATAAEPSVLAGGSLAEDESELVDDCLDALDTLTTDSPLVLTIDDFQWATRSEVATVQALTRRTNSLPVAIAIGMRPHPRSRELARLTDDVTRTGGTRIVLEPLEPDDVARLLATLIARPPGPRLCALASRVGGNPFYLCTLVDALRAEGALGDAGDLSDATGDTIPAELHELVLRHLATLDGEAIELLQFAAVLGSAVDVRELADLRGDRAVALLSVLERCRRAGVLRRDGETMRFAHDLVRDAIYRDLPLALRRTIHEDATSALRHVGAVPERLAWHRAQAASPDDPGAARALTREGRAALDQSPAAAAILAQRAVDVAPTDDPDARALLVEALARCGRAGEAFDVASAARVTNIDLRVAEAFAALQCGRPLGPEAAAALGAAAHADRAERPVLLAQAAVARLLGGDFAGAEDLATRVQHEAGTAGVHALGVRAWVASFGARFDDAVALAHAGVDTARPRSAVHSIAQFFLGMVLIDADRFDDAAAAFLAGMDNAERWLLPLHTQGVGAARFLDGQWEAAIVDLQTGVAYAEEIGSLSAVGFSRGLLALVAVARGDSATAEDHLDRADRTFKEGGAPLGLDWMIWARARLSEQRGRARDALEELSRAWDLDTTIGLHNDLRSFGPDLVRLAVAAGDIERARRVVVHLAHVASVSPLPGLRGAARRADALFLGDPELAVSALDDYRRAPRPYEHALAAVDAMELCAAAERHDEARMCFDDATEVLARLDAIGDLRGAQARARVHGLRVALPAPAAATGWDSLSELERRVVELAASGSSNRRIGEELYLSSRTIESHLTRIFAKLGVRSRVELVAHAR